MDDLFFHTLSDKTPLNEVECCANCKHIDWRSMLVSYSDETYHGYDGTYCCDKCKDSDRCCISPYWRACDVYEQKTPDDHIFEMCDQILYALEEFERRPESCKGKTKHEVIRNVLSNYVETVARYLEDNEFEWTRKRKDNKKENNEQK